jgi:hypothetical protein
VNRYEITLADGYRREIERLEVGAANLRLALLQSERLLRLRDSGHGQRAVSASIELLGAYAWEVDEVDESAGMRERALAELETELQSPGFAAAVTGLDETLKALEPELPQGSSTCVCGAVTHWQGEEADECLRCGRELQPSLIPSGRPAGPEIGSCGSTGASKEWSAWSVGRLEGALAAEVAIDSRFRTERARGIIAELQRRYASEAAAYDPRDRDEYGHGLGEIDGGEEL